MFSICLICIWKYNNYFNPQPIYPKRKSENASILSHNNIHLITVTLKIEQLVDLIKEMSKLFIVIYFLEKIHN